jgi:hypothetical protein
VHLIRYLRLFEDYWIDTSYGGLFFIQDVIHHVISVTEPLHCIQDNFSGNFDSFPCRYLIKCTRPVSGITLIGLTDWNANNFQASMIKKTKCAQNNSYAICY